MIEVLAWLGAVELTVVAVPFALNGICGGCFEPQRAFPQRACFEVGPADSNPPGTGLDLLDLDEADLISMKIYDDHVRQRLLSEAQALVRAEKLGAVMHPMFCSSAHPCCLISQAYLED